MDQPPIVESDDAELERMFDEFAESNDSANEPTASQDVDWKAKAEALEQESKQWEHKFNSDAGRVAAMQRKISELESSERVEPDVQEETDSEDLTEFMDDYPDIYTGMTAYLDKELEKRTADIRQELQQSMQPMESLVNNHQKATELDNLSSQHSDWEEVAGSPDFQNWVAQQPHQITELAQSDFASDASYVISMFKSANAMGSQGSYGESIADKRKRQLLESTSIPSSHNASSMPLAEDDEEALFNFYADKKNKR